MASVGLIELYRRELEAEEKRRRRVRIWAIWAQRYDHEEEEGGFMGENKENKENREGESGKFTKNVGIESQHSNNLFFLLGYSIKRFKPWSLLNHALSLVASIVPPLLFHPFLFYIR